jgi:hypothetical protein
MIGGERVWLRDPFSVDVEHVMFLGYEPTSFEGTAVVRKKNGAVVGVPVEWLHKDERTRGQRGKHENGD